MYNDSLYDRGEIMKKYLSIFRDLGLTVLVFASTVAVSVLLQNNLGIPEHVTTTIAFGVFLISMLTQGYVYGILAAFAGTLAINYAFTFPYFRLNFTIPTNLFSAITMIIISVLTSALTTKVKYHEAVKAESEMERMRANLLRAVSHDLRTPLTTIYGSATALLENRESLSEEQKVKMLKGITEDSEWLVRMVENLLSVTRIDSGKVKIVKMDVVLEELIDSVILKFKKRHPDLPLQLDIPEEITLIPMDPMLIEQVITNILENAVQHAVGMTTLSLRVFTIGNQAIFEIRDDGCGIRPDRLERIFTGYFVPEGQSADSQRRNAGIGLSVCATIIKAHGGDIRAENASTGGAIFRFTLNLEE